MWKLRNNPIYEISPHEFREPYSPHAYPNETRKAPSGKAAGRHQLRHDRQWHLLQLPTRDLQEQPWQKNNGFW